MKIFYCLIFIIAVGFRLYGNNWGLVTGAHLNNIGYPVEDNFKADWVVSGYVYDEERFMGALDFFGKSKKYYRDWISGQLSFFELTKYIVSAAWPGSFMQMRPVGPYFFSSTAWLCYKTGQIFGMPLSDKKDLISVYYKANRIINGIISAASMWILLMYILMSRKKNSSNWLPLLAITIFCFQPASVVHGHWVTYNSLLALAILSEMAYLNLICMRADIWSKNKFLMHCSTLSLLIGISIAAKFTAAAVIIVGAICFLLKFHWENKNNFKMKDIITSKYFFGSIILAVGGCLGFLVCIFPMFIVPNAPGITFKVEGAAYFSRTFVAAHYFLKTLPAGMGWPLYIIGLFGVATSLYNWKNISIHKISLISLIAIMIFAFTSNSLGMQPQRSLTIYLAWVVFAFWGLESLYCLEWKLFSHLVAAYLIIGGVYASSLINYQLKKDYPGYRNKISKFIVDNIDNGSNIYLHTITKHGQVDVSLYETQENPKYKKYQYLALYTWQLEKMEKINGYALYPDNWNGAEKIATYHSSLKKETRLIRYFRMFFGYHRGDQIVDVPSFSVYKIDA